MSKFLLVTNLSNFYLYPLAIKFCSKTNISFSCSKLVFLNIDGYFFPIEKCKSAHSYSHTKLILETQAILLPLYK